MFPNSASLNISFLKCLDKDSSKSSNSLELIKKEPQTHNRNTNLQNYPKKYFQNDQYIITSLYLSIKENIQKKRKNKEKQNQNSNQSDKKILPLHELEKLVHKSFIKYYNEDDYYNIMKIDEIINNEKSHLVAEFKDFLVLGDTGEFILKYYSKKDMSKIYKQILDYYDENLFIFPNYVALYESKYIYNNIQKKQKIIDIQEELNDNKNEKKNEKKNKSSNEKNKVFSVKEIESILNETDTSGIKQYFGISENNTENGIDKNEKQIIELIDQINALEKNESNNKDNKNKKQENKKINEVNGNNSKNKKLFLNNQKEKTIKGRNEKINLFGLAKVKSISDLKMTENKTLRHTGVNSQPNLYSKNNKSIPKILNSNNEKNNSKEKSNKSNDKNYEKNDILPQTKKKVIGNLYNKDNKKLLNKIMNSTKNFSIFQENDENLNNGMNKSNNKIKINKSILKEIGDYKNITKSNIMSSGNSKSYKKELMNILFNSKIKTSNTKKNQYRSNKNNNSKIDNLVNSALTDEKSAIMTTNHFFKNGQNYFKKENLKNKNKLSNSCQNIVLYPYATKNKKLNFNKTNIQFFSNRNISYKLIPSSLTSNDGLYKKKFKRHNHEWIIDSYSAKEINKRTIKKSPDSFGLKLLQNNQIKTKKDYKSIKTKKISSKSPFQIIKKESAFTDRKAQEQINNNLEKIDALTRNIKKIKENLKNSGNASRNNLSPLILENKAKSVIPKNINNKLIENNNNHIKVYLINRTRNKGGKEFGNNQINFPSFKVQTIKFTNSSRKNNPIDYKKKLTFKTINYSNSNKVIKINSKNNIDYHGENIIMNYNKK